MNHNVSYADVYYTREKSSMHRFRMYRLIEELFNIGHRIIIKQIVKEHHFECSVATALK